MAENTVEIKLIKQEGDGSENYFQEQPSSSIMDNLPTGADVPIPEGVGNIKNMLKLAAGLKIAYELVKKTYESQRSMALDDRQRNETMRSYGGASFSANTFGDRFDVFGDRQLGKAVSYIR
jgi:hypothetical protein